ncbi:Serine hydroxymethyltransferase [Phytophthora cinnamomi]|uniref:Serine hydroxymethyltransferase n=1 Tax=Phytophthora cinnamomi TaxID=4785 RepID=UPI0035597F2E|nr:Serine hydroxymethyltransferase [Phytophthora cinnamomi]
MERLQQELAALPGLEQLSASQLRALPWRVKEQVLLALFREQASSAAVAQELQRRSRDRRLERRADKLLGDGRDGRRREESFRADFMRAAAAELARLGAPALVSWQKLLFDRECCAQAFRLLLTRIKSSRRSAAAGVVTTNSSSLLAARFAAGGASRQGGEGPRSRGNNDGSDDEEEAGEGDGSRVGDDESYAQSEGRTRFPPLKPSRGSLGRAWRKESGLASRSTAVGKVDWNFDTSVETSPEADDSDEVGGRASTEKLAQSSRTTSLRTGPGISIERTVPAKQPSYFASKFKKNQVQALQEENAALTSENAKLREEIEQLEALNAVLQNDKPNNSQLDDHEDSMEFAQRRMRLLQAQNLQLRRQTSLLQDAMQAQANAETNLLSALNQWRGVIDAGRKEAKAAGADENAAEAPAKPEQTGGQRQPIKWMLAIPEKLMDELQRVEGQIRGAANAANACYETKLRVSKLSASFIRDNDTTIKLSEIYGREPSSLAHLRIDRVKQLEEALAIVAGELVQLSAQVLERLAPTVSTTDPVRSHAYELSRSVRELLLEVGAFGAVVCTPSATVPSSRGTTATIDAECITAVDVMKALSSTSGVARGPSGAKEREKQAKVMLKQLHARYTAMDNNAVVCRREAEYWRTAWQTQDDLIRRLARRVRHLGQTKVEWCQHYLLAPMTNLAEVYASFQQSYDENSTRQNPYLPLLVETLSMEHPMLQDALHQWQEYTSSVQLKMDELVADYEDNRLVLASSAASQRFRPDTPVPEYNEDTLPSDSEQVRLH